MPDTTNTCTTRQEAAAAAGKAGCQCIRNRILEMCKALEQSQILATAIQQDHPIHLINPDSPKDNSML
jgi:hypothetical protein